MKIAIPVTGGRVATHFGHCERFAVVEVDQSNKAVSETAYVTPPRHEPGMLPRWLHEQGVDLVIAGGMGSRAQSLFNEAGIEVLMGAPADTPEQTVSAYLNGSLQTGQNVCDH